jgi:hypothetical protein
MGGLSHNVWLRRLCAGVSRHTGHVTTHYSGPAGYDQLGLRPKFCFDLRPNLELRSAPAPAWRAHIRYHVQFTVSARGVCFVLQARPC